MINHITRHNHNNYEHNVKRINRHIQHINNYEAEINYCKKSNNYYNFHHDTFNFRKNEIVHSSQQNDITNNIIDTNTQSKNYIGENYVNSNKIATVMLNPTPSTNENYLWIPGVSDNVVPGLGSMLTCIQSKYATVTALQNAITNISNNIHTGINNLEINNQGNLNVNEVLYCHSNYTDYTFQRNNTIHKYDNHRTSIIQNHFPTYQRKCNQELQIQ